MKSSLLLVVWPQDSWRYSLAKEGWPRHQVNGSVPLKSADGVVRSTSDNRWLERTTLPCFALSGSHSLRSCPSAPLRTLRRFFLMGAATPPLPSFAKEGGSSIRMLRDIY